MMTHSLIGQELRDVNSVDSSQRTPVTSEAVVRQINAVTDRLTTQLELLWKKPSPPQT